jgi:hypothetical protein
MTVLQGVRVQDSGWMFDLSAVGIAKVDVCVYSCGSRYSMLKKYLIVYSRGTEP